MENNVILTPDEIYNLLTAIKANPKWVTSRGEKVISCIGLCHQGHGQSVIYIPSINKFHCFSTCGHNWSLSKFVQRALNLATEEFALEAIEKWADKQEIDYEGRELTAGDFDERYNEQKFSITGFEEIKAMPQEAIEEIFSQADSSLSTLAKTVWHTQDGIQPEILKLYDVAYNPKDGCILLPHHNANGEIVGIYERNFLPLRKEVERKFPDLPPTVLMKFPKAKYYPILKDKKYLTDKKTCWSFSNSFNLYGLHLAKDKIKENGVVVVVEGAKSVMLLRQWGIPAVATHTFGTSLTQLELLMRYGAKQIILGFDKQYKEVNDIEWNKYVLKTEKIAKKVQNQLIVFRLRDDQGLLNYKDAPVDKGKEVFLKLLLSKERIDGGEEFLPEVFTKEEAEEILEEKKLLEAYIKIKRKQSYEDFMKKFNLN